MDTPPYGSTMTTNSLPILGGSMQDLYGLPAPIVNNTVSQYDSIRRGGNDFYRGLTNGDSLQLGTWLSLVPQVITDATIDKTITSSLVFAQSTTVDITVKVGYIQKDKGKDVPNSVIMVKNTGTKNVTIDVDPSALGGAFTFEGGASTYLLTPLKCLIFVHDAESLGWIILSKY